MFGEARAKAPVISRVVVLVSKAVAGYAAIRTTAAVDVLKKISTFHCFGRLLHVFWGANDTSTARFLKSYFYNGTILPLLGATLIEVKVQLAVK